MRVLAFSDLHGSIDLVERVLVLERSFDLVVLAGDITTAGTTSEITKAIERVGVFRKPVVAVAGNMDPLPLERALERLGVSIDSRGAVFGDAGFFGVSAAPESPMRTPNEISEREIMDRAEAGWKAVAAARWKIFVPHASPRDTLLDLTHSGEHAGSTAVRDFILRRKPDAVICGHIHEARGIDTINGVPAVNCGPAGKGYYALVTIGETITMENRSLK
ncbi:MAG TPA: metallophosphoesterase [Bacteroidota bacterium]|nr:metallophosphoesterase [Bacteroidota bacterium]